MAEKSSGGWWKWLLVLAVLAGAGGGYYYWRQHSAVKPSFNTVVVERGEITNTVTATGTLNPVVNVTVGSQVSGRICKLNVDWNSVVKSNQVIAEIDPASYQAAVEQAKADLANAEANLELQQVQCNRSSDLFTNKLISGSDYDTAVANLHEAEAMVKIKQASLYNSKVNLDYCKIVSPVDGVVILRAVELGQTVASSFSTPTIFQIANDLTKMQIDANVAEADVGGVQVGQSVDFTVDAYPYRTFHGAVTQVRNSPTTVNNVVTYDAVISVTNADYKLKPGMTANVSVIIAQRPNVLKLRNAALRFRPPDNSLLLSNTVAAGPAGTNQMAGGPPFQQPRPRANRNEHTVYLLAADAQGPKLQPVQIKTGITDGVATEVIEGLAEGDKVVTGLMSLEGMGAAPGSNPFGGGFPRR